jgi:hypothetical protein
MIGCRLFQKELEILMRVLVKFPELVSVFIEASRNLKRIFLNN